MKMRSAALALLLVAGMMTSGNLLACGDKFLVMGRGLRLERAVPRKPAAILVYASSASNLTRTLPNIPIETALRKAGHRPTSVASEDELDKALRLGGWDLVLVDVAESGTVSGRLRGHSVPVLLRVVHNATRTEFKQAKRQYEAVLKSPTRSQAFLDSIDEALLLRIRPRPIPGAKTTI